MFSSTYVGDWIITPQPDTSDGNEYSSDSAEGYQDPMLECPNNSPYDRNPLADNSDNPGRDRDYDCFPNGYDEAWEETSEAMDEFGKLFDE